MRLQIVYVVVAGTVICCDDLPVVLVGSLPQTAADALGGGVAMFDIIATASAAKTNKHALYACLVMLNIASITHFSRFLFYSHLYNY